MSGEGDNTANLLNPDQDAKGKALRAQLIAGMSPEQNQVIITNVLKFVNPNELKNYAQVCPLWQDIIVRLVGVPLFIGSRSRCWTPDVVFEHPSLVGQIATPVLTISELKHPIDQLRPVKYPEIVTTMLIDGETTLMNFQLLVANPLKIMTNLVNFTIDWTTINSIPLGGVTLTFPSLKMFRLWSLEATEAVINTTDKWTQGLENVVHLLQQAKYPQLRKLFLTFVPVHTGGDAIPTILALITCISTHKKTLRKVLLDFVGIAPDNPSPNAQDGIFVAALPSLLDACRGLSLTHGMIRCDEDVRGNSHFSVLSQIITQSVPSQEGGRFGRRVGLESIYLNTGLHPTASSLQSLQANVSTLKSIEMDIGLADGALDCSAFHGCTQLKILTLIGRTRRVTRSDEYNAEVLETPQLPSSLESLRLIRLRISTANADFLITRTAALGSPLAKLRVVELQEIGQVGGLGVSMHAIQQSWQNRTIQKLSLRKAVNLESLNQTTAAFPNSMSALLFKQSLEEDSDYAFGICLTCAESGQSAYAFGWEQPADEARLWEFAGKDPKLHFSTVPLDLDSLDVSNEDENVEGMDADDDGEYGEFVEQLEVQEGEDDNTDEMEYEEEPDDEEEEEEDDDGDGDGDEDFDQPQ